MCDSPELLAELRAIKAALTPQPTPALYEDQEVQISDTQGFQFSYGGYRQAYLWSPSSLQITLPDGLGTVSIPAATWHPFAFRPGKYFTIGQTNPVTVRLRRTNESVVDTSSVNNVSGQEVVITSPADGSTIAVTTDTIITWQAPVTRIRLQNQHATAKVYWRIAGTNASSTAFNLVPPNNNTVEWIAVNTQTMHIFSDTVLTSLFNAAGGFIVRGFQ